MKKIVSKILHHPQNQFDSFTWDFRFDDGTFASDYRISFGNFHLYDILFVAKYGFQYYYFSKVDNIVYVINWQFSY